MHGISKKILATLTIPTMTIILSACSSINAKYNPHKPLAPQVDRNITGIEAGDDSSLIARNTIKAYHLDKKNWQVQNSSTAAMTSQLGRAYQKKSPIIVTGWQPHWIFKKYHLKFLKDPKNMWGKSEHIDAVTHKGFQKKNPGAYKMLSQFHWTSSNMSDVMMKVNGGEQPANAAKDFIKDNPKLINKWTKGVPRGHGQSVILSNVAWDSEIASTNVVAQTLNKLGYNASIRTMEPQPMFESVALGDADATVSVWLPVTHHHLFDQYKSKLQIAGDTLNGAKTGFVVPKYMKNINSINDLNN